MVKNINVLTNIPCSYGSTNAHSECSLPEVPGVERCCPVAELARRVDGFVGVRGKAIMAVVNLPILPDKRGFTFSSDQR